MGLIKKMASKQPSLEGIRFWEMISELGEGFDWLWSSSGVLSENISTNESRESTNDCSRATLVSVQSSGRALGS